VLGEVLNAQGAYTDALAVYQAAAVRAPEEAAFHREAGILLRRRFDDAESARAALEAALALAPEDAATRLELARIFADRGACYEAEAYLDFLLSGPPVGGNEKNAHVLAAQCHLDQERPRTAIPYLEAVVSDAALAGKDPAISHLLLLAAAYEAAGDLEAAVAAHERTLEINPDHAGALAALERLTGPADE
jgi:tetratricopeptide (TPR) repeat protein